MLNETFSVIFKQCVTLQKMVILLALPPNWAILSRNHCKAINWSKRSLPGTSSVSKNKKVRPRGNEGKITVLKAHFARIFAHRELCSALVVNFDVSKTMKMMMMRTAKSSRAAVTISCKNVDWLTFHQFSRSSLLCRISQIFNTTAVKSVKMKYHRNCKQQNCFSREMTFRAHLSNAKKSTYYIPFQGKSRWKILQLQLFINFAYQVLIVHQKYQIKWQFQDHVFPKVSTTVTTVINFGFWNSLDLLRCGP